MYAGEGAGLPPRALQAAPLIEAKGSAAACKRQKLLTVSVIVF